MCTLRQAIGIEWITGFPGVSAFSCFTALATMLLFTATGAQAGGLTVLPGAVSYEYMGFNFVQNAQSSSAVGTLNYNAGAGCGGICLATTVLGADPAVSLNVNEVVYQNTGGGGAVAELGYYVEYANPTPGTYSVNVRAPEGLSITDGASSAFAFLALGPTDGSVNTLNRFASFTLQEADCVLYGCQRIPGLGLSGATPAPFTVNHSVQMVANTAYWLLIDVEIQPSTTGQQVSGFVDPQFSTTASGGSFVFSPGATDSSATPEPGALVLMLSGFALLGGLLRRRTLSVVP